MLVSPNYCYNNVITYSATADELTLTFTLSYNLRQRKRIRMVYLQHKSYLRKYRLMLLIAIRSSNIDYNFIVLSSCLLSTLYIKLVLW